MIRTLSLVALLSCFVAVSWADEEEPKLERKKQKEEVAPKGGESKKDAEAIPKKDGDKEPKKDGEKEAKKDGEDTPKNLNQDEIEKAKERIVENSKTAGKRLGDKDPGEETRKVQNDILKDLDELLKQAQNQQNQQGGGGGGGGSSSNSKSGPGQLPNKGGGSGKQSSGGGSSSSRQERRERREQAKNNPMNGGSQGQGGNPKEQDAKEKLGQGQSGKDSASSGGATGGSPMTPNAKPTGKFAEVYKDVWGHLPEKLRQEMDLYYREQFMPRYTELLREYYSALAEQKRKSGKE